MPKILYKKQKEILTFIKDRVSMTGFAPTLTEIAEYMGLSSLSTVHEHLSVLEKKGFIRRYKGAVRGIELLEQEDDLSSMFSVELPVLGYIACGEPIEPYEDPNATLTVNPSLLKSGVSSYVLQARGDSMVDDGILDGDYVVIEETQNVKNGDIVVAMLPGGFATLKRFYREENRIRLQPANSTMSPIYVKNVEVRGRVISVIRRFS